MSKCIEITVPMETEIFTTEVLELMIPAEDSVIEVLFEDNRIHVARP